MNVNPTPVSTRPLAPICSTTTGAIAGWGRIIDFFFLGKTVRYLLATTSTGWLLLLGFMTATERMGFSMDVL
jgi:hypothetical protein